MRKYLYYITSSLIFATSAVAQEAPADEAEQSNREIVVSATGFAEPRDETGAAISVIDRERLDQLQVVTVNDALRTLPGVSVAKRGSIGTQTSLFVRGGNSSQTLVLIDGVRVNDPSSPNAAFDFGPLLAGNFARIELLRGPNSIIWGSQAIGGVVNVETPRSDGPLLVDTAIEYGADDTVSAYGIVSGTAGIFELSAGGSYYRTDGISALTGAPGAERDGSRVYGLNGRVKVNLTANLSLDLRSYYNDSRVNYDSPFSGGANSLALTDNDQLVLYAGANLDLADGRFRSRVAYTRSEIDRVGTDPVAFSFNTFVAEGTTERFEYRGALDIADFATLAAGAEYEKIRSRVSFEGAAPDLAENDVTSGYAQLTLRPLSGLSVTGGMRLDDYSDYGSQTTFGGNAAYTPNGGRTVFRATYGEGFRAPTLTEGQPPFGNPNLKPETARNLDLGVEQALLDERVRLGATYFRRRTNDQIAFSFATFQSENIERVHTEGLELTLLADPTRTLHIEANYTLTDAINRSGANAGKRLQYRPKHGGTVTADWESPIGVKLGGTLTVAGESFDDAANAIRIEGHAVFDLRASYPLTETIELYGRVENLFDEDYATVAGYGTFGRSAFAGVRARF